MTRYIVVMTHRPDGWRTQLEQEFTSYAQAELAAQQLMRYIPDEYRDYEVKQIVYQSKDGTRVPMFITYKKGLKLDGNNPTFL